MKPLVEERLALGDGAWTGALSFLVSTAERETLWLAQDKASGKGADWFSRRGDPSLEEKAGKMHLMKDPLG